MKIGTLFCFICSLLLTTCMGGCAHTRWHNVLTYPDGRVVTQDFGADTLSMPGGKADLTAHNLDAQFGTGKVAVGQSAKGVDNTAQGGLISAIIEWAMKYGTSKAGTTIVDEVVP